MDHANARELRARAPHPGGAAKVRLLREFDPAASGELDVPDPYYGGGEGFDLVLDLVESACRGLLDDVRLRLGVG
jgi:protein-tyrosine phosphatase